MQVHIQTQRKQLFPEKKKNNTRQFLYYTSEDMEVKLTAVSRIYSQLIRWILASVTLAMAVCSINAESCANTRTRPAKALSPWAPWVKLWSWMIEELLLPEIKWNWSSSCLKKSRNPSLTQLMMNSLSLTTGPESSSTILWKSWHDQLKEKKIYDN